MSELEGVTIAFLSFQKATKQSRKSSRMHRLKDLWEQQHGSSEESDEKERKTTFREAALSYCASSVDMVLIPC